MINYSNLTTLYVSQKNGNDNETGFYPEKRADLNGPLKSVEEALKKVSQLREFNFFQPIEIVILDDIYFVQKPIEIDEKIYDVTITSCCKTVVSGGRKIENFKEDVFNGVNCLSAKIEDIDDGFWFTDFYVDDKRADLTCYPKDNSLLQAQDVENKGIKLSDSSKWFIADKKDIEVFKNFRNFGDCFISYNHYWVDEHTPIESYDLESGRITFKYRSRFTIELTHPASAIEYKIENVAEMFSKKNEWYLDRISKKVYYIPRNENQTAQNITAYAPVTDKLFVIKGKKDKKVCNIRFSNLVFANTKGDYRSIYKRPDYINFEHEIDDIGFSSDVQSVCYAHGTIEFYHSHNCFLENCVLKNLGVHALTINEGCSKIAVSDNDFYDLGAGAIKISGGAFGCEKQYETYGNIIKNNYITDSGNRYFAACGILIMHSYENTIANNEISYQYYSGISVGWVWGYGDNITKDNLIEKNYIHHIGQGKLSDMGGVYLLGKQRGTIVRNNIIHDIKSKHYGGWALYTDEGSSYIILENNICYNTSSNSYHHHFGTQNVVKNNIFVKSETEPIFATRNDYNVGIICEKNIVVSQGTAAYKSGYGLGQAGHTGMMFHRDNLIFDFNNEAYSLVVNDKKYNPKEAYEAFGFDVGTIVADPLFVDYENNNFELKENSPAFKLGFKKINTADVGVKR